MTNYRKLEKVRKDAQKQADRDHAEVCIVSMPTNGEDVLYLRKPARARNLIRKHADARLIETIKPREES